ncbi:DUF397 domain-containing protein [Actinomadura harenae]|uniref:DUF397 domain-containing protein n=1 Tax=Actinomadura harenae TaxID=2483351 RepID=A0A3M2M2G1_9ACTN|nr:DUF397 domain-containing protein [Actinomadura harenae]RMI43789.1 DUF397 domain-containing protein [Actinomadura harenae]
MSTRWRKSSHSDEAGGQCVELAALNGNVAVRDSKVPGAGHLNLTPSAFADLVTCMGTDRGAQSEA